MVKIFRRGCAGLAVTGAGGSQSATAQTYLVVLRITSYSIHYTKLSSARFLRGRFGGDTHAYMGIISAVLTSIAAIVVLNADTLKTVYIANAVMQFVAVLWSGAASGIVTSLVLPRMRATAAAFYLAMVTFLGLAMGPYIIGFLSDSFVAGGMASAEALRQSLQLGFRAEDNFV